MRIWTHGMIHRLIMLLDSLLILAGIVLVSHADIGGRMPLFSAYTALYIGGYLALMNIGRAYRIEHYASVLRQMRQVGICTVVAGVLVCVIDRHCIGFTAETAGAAAARVGAVWAAVMTGRVVAARFGLYWVDRLALLRRKTLIVGDGGEIAAQVRALRAGAHCFDLVGALTTGDGAAPAMDIPVLGTTDDLIPALTANPPDVVIIALPWSDARRISVLVEQLSRFAIDSYVPLQPDVFEPRFAQVARVGQLQTLQVIRAPLRGSLVLIKQVEDYVVAAIGLVLSAPILLICGLIIKLESPGPVFYRQTRVGYNNRLFDVYKLRTMTVDPSDDGAEGTRRGDPRITRSGRWLRRLSLDELPQLVNVLRGEMSVVGPRPHVPNMLVGESLRYETLRAYIHRYRVKPGITGWAQLNGMRGGIHTPEKARAGIELDLHYIENWSLWFDIRIMLLTITKGMAGPDVF